MAVVRDWKMFKCFFKALPLLLSTALFLSGCAQIVGAAQRTHEYYLHYTMNFDIGGYTIQADRYGEVQSVYENFGLTTCDRSRPKCWVQDTNFFIPLPSGDNLYVSSWLDTPFDGALSTFSGGQTENTVLKLVAIYGDRPFLVGTHKGEMSCLPMLDAALLKKYGLHPIKISGGFATYLKDIKVKVERVDSIPDAQQKYRDWYVRTNALITKAWLEPLRCEKIFVEQLD